MLEFRRARWRTIAALSLALLLVCPAWSYDFPLSSRDIRDAYFLGSRQAGMGDDFLSQYTHVVPTLQLSENLISRVRIETPFLLVAAHASKTLNYNAQEAVKDFYGKPAVFRMTLEICYMIDAPQPNSIKITVLQNDKPILPRLDDRSPFFTPTDPYTPAIDVGEIVNMQFDPAKFDSSTLTIQIDTPDDQHAKAEFDLQTLR